MPKIKGWISWFIRYNRCKVCLSFSHELWPKFGNRWISRIGSLRFWWNSVQRKALMRTICSREISTKKWQQQQIFDSDLKGAWHYNHVTFTPIAKNFMLYCRLIYSLSILWVGLTIKVKVRIPESFKVGWYSPKKLGQVTLKRNLHCIEYKGKWRNKMKMEMQKITRSTLLTDELFHCWLWEGRNTLALLYSIEMKILFKRIFT